VAVTAVNRTFGAIKSHLTRGGAASQVDHHQTTVTWSVYWSTG